MARRKELWHPVDTYDAADVRAIQTLALYAQGAERPWPEGHEPPVPSPHDVKRALDCIIYKLSQTYEEPFVAGQPDAVAYVLGRGSVGRAIIKLMKLKASLIGGK